MCFLCLFFNFSPSFCLFFLIRFLWFSFLYYLYFILLFFRNLLFLFYDESLRVGFRAHERQGGETGGSRGRKTMIKIYCIKESFFNERKKKHFFFISTSLSMKEIQNKTALRFHLTQLIMVKIRETNMWKQRKGATHRWYRCGLAQALGQCVEFLHKGRKNSPYDPVYHS